MAIVACPTMVRRDREVADGEDVGSERVLEVQHAGQLPGPVQWGAQDRADAVLADVRVALEARVGGCVGNDQVVAGPGHVVDHPHRPCGRCRRGRIEFLPDGVDSGTRSSNVPSSLTMAVARMARFPSRRRKRVARAAPAFSSARWSTLATTPSTSSSRETAAAVSISVSTSIDESASVSAAGSCPRSRRSRRGAVPLPHGERPAEEVAGALRVAAGLVQRCRTLERQPLEVGEPARCRRTGGVEEAGGGVEPAGAGGALGGDEIEERPMVTGVRLRPALQQADDRDEPEAIACARPPCRPLAGEHDRVHAEAWHQVRLARRVAHVGEQQPEVTLGALVVVEEECEEPGRAHALRDRVAAFGHQQLRQPRLEVDVRAPQFRLDEIRHEVVDHLQPYRRAVDRLLVPARPHGVDVRREALGQRRQRLARHDGGVQRSHRAIGSVLDVARRVGLVKRVEHRLAADRHRLDAMADEAVVNERRLADEVAGAGSVEDLHRQLAVAVPELRLEEHGRGHESVEHVAVRRQPAVPMVGSTRAPSSTRSTAPGSATPSTRSWPSS